MSITNRIRRSPIVVTTVLLAFVVGYLFPYLSEISYQFFSPSKVNIGIIAGHKVAYYPDYRNLYDETLRQEIQRYGQYYQGIEANVHRKVWEKLTLQYAFRSTYHSLGLEVTPEERYDMVLGNDIPAYMRTLPQFQDPNTETFDRRRYLMFWKQVANDPLRKEIAKSFEEELATTRLQEKLGMLIEKSTHAPNTLQKKTQQQRKGITIRVLIIPYASIPDSTVRNKVSQQDKKAYYQTQKEAFAVKEEESSKTIAYVQFPILPDSQEIKQAEQALANLKERFLQLKPQKAKTFATQYTDNPDEVMVQWEEKELPRYLKDALTQHKDKKAYPVIGPVRQGAVAVLYKYVGLAPNQSWAISKKEPIHQFAKIERKVDTQGISKNKTFTEASNFVRAAKHSHTWTKVANEEYGLSINEATITLEEARQVGSGNYRKLKRWLFCDAKIGTISPPIPIKDQYYLVAKMTQEQKSGYLTYTQVEKKIEKALFNQQKAGIIKDKLSSIGTHDKSLYQIKQIYGADAFIFDNPTLYFHHHQIVTNYHAPRAVGAAFALKVGERTLIIEDEKYIVIIERVPNSPQLTAQKTTHPQESKETTQTKEKEKIVNLILAQEKIQDDRFRFYD